MSLTVAVENPLQDDVRALIGALDAHLQPLSPEEYQFKLTAEQMAGADTTVFVARDEAGSAVGCGALKLHGGGQGEVKRMFTEPQARGKRVGTAILSAIEAAARANGVRSLKLETGTGDGFAGALRLYARAGFVPCGAFLGYPESPYSAFFEKTL